MRRRTTRQHWTAAQLVIADFLLVDARRIRRKRHIDNQRDIGFDLERARARATTRVKPDLFLRRRNRSHVSGGGIFRHEERDGDIIF